MEVYQLRNDLTVFCVEAPSYPDGILKAFHTLEQLLPSIKDRTFFGISYQDEAGRSIYKAAVLEAYEGEGRQYGCDTFIVRKGDYLTEKMDWRKAEGTIRTNFILLLAEAQPDSSSPCIEWYKGDDELLCMVKIGCGGFHL